MHRRDVLKICGGGNGLAGCLAQSGETTFTEGFENGIGDWQGGAAIGPEVDLADFEWEIGVDDTEAVEGEHSLRVWNEGRHDDGTTWAIHPIPIESGRVYDVRVMAEYWSPGESFNLIRSAVMYLGPDPPSREEDFPQSGQNTTDFDESPIGGLREPLWLVDGWQEYAFEWTTPVLSTDTVHLAVGTTVV